MQLLINHEDNENSNPSGDIGDEVPPAGLAIRQFRLNDLHGDADYRWKDYCRKENKPPAGCDYREDGEEREGPKMQDFIEIRKDLVFIGCRLRRNYDDCDSPNDGRKEF